MRPLCSCRFRRLSTRVEKRAWTPPYARQFWCALPTKAELRNCRSIGVRAEHPVATPERIACRALRGRLRRPEELVPREEALPQVAAKRDQAGPNMHARVRRVALHVAQTP